MPLQFEGRTTNYGQTVGILMLDTAFPRVPGDIGNATTFSYPVRYYTVQDANYTSVVDAPDRALIDAFVFGGKQLVREGCRAVFTSCGFMALFQREISAQLEVPFISSSLMQVKYISDMLPPGRKVGVITAFADQLTRKHLEAVGIQNIPMAISGLDGSYFGNFLRDMDHVFDFDRAQKDMLCAAEKLLAENSDVSALVLECTNMPPFAAMLRERFRLPVFDMISLMDYVVYGFVRGRFHGFL